MKASRRDLLLIFIAFLTFFIPRIVGLGWDISGYDVHYWRPRMWNFVKAIETGNFKETYQKYHPGVTLMWLSGFSERAFERLAEFKVGRDLRYEPKYYPVRHFVAKLPLVFVISLLGAVCFYLLRDLVDARYAFVFSFLLSLEPFFLGISRFLHLSALTSMFSFTSFLLMCVYLRKERRIHFYLSAVCVGLATLTKVNGASVGLANVLLLAFYRFRQPRALSSRQVWRVFLSDTLIQFLVSVGTFFVLFPAMWVDPLGVVEKIVDRGVSGTALSSNRGARMLVPTRFLYYFEAFFLRSLPTTVFLVIGGCVALRGKSRRKSFVRENIILLFILWLTLSVSHKTKDRYVVAFYPPLMTFAALAIYEFTKVIRRPWRLFAVGLLCGYYVLTIYRYHPIYSFYWNDAIGGQRGVERLGLPIIKRGEGFAQAALFVNDYKTEPGDKNAVVINKGQNTSFAEYFFGKTYSGPTLMPDGCHAHYFVCAEDFVYQVPQTCDLIKTVGVRPPFRYDHVFVYYCGKTIDNSYKGIKN